MMQVFEAARFTIDWINNSANNYNIPGVVMGEYFNIDYNRYFLELQEYLFVQFKLYK